MSLFKGTIFTVLLLTLGCSAQTPAFSPETKSHIEKQVRMIYEDRMPPDVQIAIGNPAASEVQGYDQITVSFIQGARRQTQDFLVSKDGKTLARFTKWDITKDPYLAVMDKMNLAGRPYKGNKDAKVVIVNYDDFQCPFCSQMHATLNQVAQKYGDKVKLVYKDFPLVQIHPWAMRAALDANCLAAQSTDAYWSFADYVHSHGPEISGDRKDVKLSETRLDQAAREQGQRWKLQSWKLDSCMANPDEKAVRASMDEGSQLEIEATPTLFINGERIPGALPASQLEMVINRALRNAGEQPPASSTATATAPASATAGAAK